ncbi:hypothetical protein [Aliiroseovarius marinus]|uniref:hypothetical protein n=1 Tax=Aliiroseovarius marinus TaxID=2500159 RepID=UPI003D7D15E8
MERKNTPSKAQKNGADRETRLKAALKANMARRKAQAKARAGGTQAQDSQNKE